MSLNSLDINPIKTTISVTPCNFTGPEMFEFNTVVEGLANSITRTVVDLQDKRIREGLIALGWTPPDRDQQGGL